MSAELTAPFLYNYMINAMFVSSLVGALCGFLSAYLILRGWSLIGDALSHSIVPGVAGAYMIGVPLFVGAFLSGGLAALTMLFVQNRTFLKEDVIIGLIFTTFFGLGLFMISLDPISVDIQTIISGNILSIAPFDIKQIFLIGGVSFLILVVKWKDFFIIFFDEAFAISIGFNANLLKVTFFTIVSASCVAALQAVGAFLVIAMLVTPGATAYLLTDRFKILIIISVAIGAFSGLSGTYLSFFLDGATGGLIVLIQTGLFFITFFLTPKNGYKKNTD